MTTRRLLASLSAATILPVLFAVTFFLNGTAAEAQVPSTRTFGNAGWDAVHFFFIEKGIKPYQDGVAIDDDAATTQKICQLAGYSRVQFLRSKNFASCGDNFIEYWNGSAWIRSAACSRQPFIDTLTCADPIVASSSSSSSSSSIPSSTSSSPSLGSSSSSAAGGFSAIDVKINGQDGTVNAPLGSIVTISWTSNGVQRCDTDGSQSPWGPNRSVPTSGSENVVVTKSMTFSIQCAQTATSPMIVMDVVGVNATSSASSSSSSFSTSFPSSSSSISFSTSSFSNSSINSSSFSSMAPGMGCIQIYKQAYDMNGNEYPVTPQFTFVLDGSQTAFNGAYGRARFDNVTPGTHTVSEIVPNGWRQLLVTPENGVVSVAAGRCAGIVFVNRQMLIAGSSSSSSSTSSVSSVSSGSSSISSSSINSSSSSVSSSISSASSSLVSSGLSSASSSSINSSSLSSSSASSVSSASSMSSSLSSSISSSSLSSSVISSSSSSISSVSSIVSSSSVSSSSSASSINLTIAKTDNRSSVNRNDRITYTISITNASGTDATNTTVTDDLPPQVTFVSASNGGTLSSQRVTWNGLTVPANSTLFITVTVDVNGNAAAGTMTNLATVNNGNSATDNTTVNAPPQTFLQLTKFASYQQIGSSRTIDYTVTVRNAGSAAANDIVVTDNTDSDTTITNAGGGTQAGNQLQWNAGTMAINETRTFQYRVSVNAGTPAGTVISNTVRASGSNAAEVQVTLNLTLVSAGNNVQFAQNAISSTTLIAKSDNVPESPFSAFFIRFLNFLSPLSVLKAIAATI